MTVTSFEHPRQHNLPSILDRLRDRLSTVAVRDSIKPPMNDNSSPADTVSFATIADITAKLRNEPNSPNLHESLTTATESLATRIRIETPRAEASSDRQLGIAQVWTALHAYDAHPTDETYDLAQTAVNHMAGEAPDSPDHAATSSAAP